ncbi:hypothetical protein [Paucisalibacillus globulus]|uniref:hypothetical protein n=1 Tax=Paucisalibacillus globulus TaxID=351095 RepID=UPI000BB83135|nr:hypothetical protein [Paucisalibacillus globulus]
MSENRRVIRVKDLVIEAENVIIKPKRRYDPIIGGVREEGRMESSSSSDNDEHRDDRDRGPFSWI